MPRRIALERAVGEQARPRTWSMLWMISSAIMPVSHEGDARLVGERGDGPEDMPRTASLENDQHIRRRDFFGARRKQSPRRGTGCGQSPSACRRKSMVCTVCHGVLPFTREKSFARDEARNGIDSAAVRPESRDSREEHGGTPVPHESQWPAAGSGLLGRWSRLSRGPSSGAWPVAAVIALSVPMDQMFGTPVRSDTK